MKRHHKWARLMSKFFAEGLNKYMTDVNDGQVWSPITQALSLIPRPCGNCKNIALYRLVHWRVEGWPFDYHGWGCAECGQAFFIATGDDGVEVEPYKFDSPVRFINSRGQR